MPRRRASRRKSRRKTVFSILLSGLLLIILGLAVYFVSSYLKNSDKAAGSKTQTHVVNPKKDPEEKKETTTSSQAPVSSFDLAAIAAGDYTSAAGTWTNELGDNLKLNATGLESAAIRSVTEFTLASGQATGDGIYQATLTSADGTVVYNLLFVKGGTTIPAERFTEGHSDTSDTARDRLYISSETLFGDDNFSKSVLYKSDQQNQ
ncbi:DUF6287 domain-containing protein [Streptococcus orisasini]